MSIYDGLVTEAGLPCTVTFSRDEIRILLSDNTAELRIKSIDADQIAAQFRTLPAGLDDLDDGAEIVLLEDAVLVRA